MRENLKKARQAAGLTQQQIADKLGIGLRHYKKLEKGETLGSIPIWDKLEIMFNINQMILRENPAIHHGKADSQ